MGKISVAMATYNGEKYIIKQLQSLYAQSCPADEVIICDDASTDQTVTLVRSFIAEKSLSHWRLLCNEKNLGFRKNFQQAIAKTNGDLIFLADQDDLWETDKIALMASLLSAHPEIKALNCSYSYIDENGELKPVRARRGYCNGNHLRLDVTENQVAPVPFEAIVCHNYFPGCTMAMTKELKDLFLQVYRETMLHDWCLNFLASFYFDGLYFYNRALIGYRIHAQNTIGMDVVFHKTVSSRSGIDRRLDEVTADEAHVRSFLETVRKDEAGRDGKIAYLEACLNFFGAKKRALEAKSVIKILELYKSAAIYRCYQSPKSRLMDLYAVLKRG